MKLLWFLNRSGINGEYQPVGYYGEMERTTERTLGKRNVSFYGKDLPTRHSSINYSDSPPYYPKRYNPIDRPLKDIIYDEHPDVILIDNSFYKSFAVDDLRDISKRVCVASFMTDAHTEWNTRRLFSSVLDMIITRFYGGGIGHRIKRDLGCAVGYSPPSVSPDIYYDRRSKNVEREYDIYLSGACNIYYPIRCNIDFWTARQCYPTTELEREIRMYGWHPEKMPKRKNTRTFIWNNIKYLIDYKLIGINEYIENLNMTKILPFDTSTFKYGLRKFFEGMSCNVLIMSDLPSDWEALRLQPNINMVEINFTNFLDKFKFYLEGNDRKRVVRNAMHMFSKYHTTKARVEQLLSQLEELINSKSEDRVFDHRNVKGEAGRQLEILEKNEKIFNRNSLLNQSIDNMRILSEWTTIALAEWEEYLKMEDFNKNKKILDFYDKTS